MICQNINATKEWEVLFTAENAWRVGIYRPKFSSADEIFELEKHTCPEAFLLLEGDITILFKNSNGAIAQKHLKKNELVVVTEPHAGFSPHRDGVAIVIENAVFSTDYTSRENDRVIRSVRVGF